MADSKSRSEIAPTEDRITLPTRNVYRSPASLPANSCGPCRGPLRRGDLRQSLVTGCTKRAKSIGCRSRIERFEGV